MEYPRYPFIDLAVHAAIRDRFAHGVALAVATPDLGRILWANGAAAGLFGFSSIYELIEDGLDRQPALKRQIAGAVLGLARKDGQDFMIRVARGFRRTVIGARVELVELPGGAAAVLISISAGGNARGETVRARQIISGFDNTDTHVAALDAEGRVLAGSPSFLEVLPSDAELARMVSDVGGEPDRLVKRIIGTARGPMPAAIGRLTDAPALHLVFLAEPAAAEEEEEEEEVALSPATSRAAADAAEAAGAMVETDHDVPEMPPRLPSEDELEAGKLSQPEAADDVPAGAKAPEAAASEELSVTAEEEAATEAAPAPDAPEAPRAAFSETEAEAGGEDFVFDPDSKPIRFVWKIDRKGAFSEVSPEFGATVGPNAADIIGRSFPEIARVFNLDPDHVIADLLNRRDTWSGKSVNWPIQGTDMVVPVDLAALPTYTRDRQFDGFRGFGIVRVAEARPDREAIGLALAPAATPETAEESLVLEDVVPGEGREAAAERTEPPAETGPAAEPSGETEEIAPETAEPPTDAERPAEPAAPEEEAPEEADPFRGERPAIALAPTPVRRETDKVIDLEARRSRARETLSPLEQAAFREIGEKLGMAIGDPQEDADAEKPERSAGGEPGPDLPEELETGAMASEVEAPGGAEDAEADDERAPSGPGEDAPARPASEAADPEKSIEEEESERDEPAEASEEAAEAEPEGAGAAPEERAPAAAPAHTIPSAFALPPRQAFTDGLSGAIIDMIPAALLVHAGDRLYHANREFLSLTGYDSLPRLEETGGLGALLGQEAGAQPEGALTLRRADGQEVPVSATLRSINWRDTQALLLALTPLSPAVGETESAPEPANDDAPRRAAPEAQRGTFAEEESFRRMHALEVETRELRSILETATDGVVILGEDGQIRSINGSAAALFGYDEGEIRGKPFVMLFAHESQRAVMDYLTGLSEHGVSSVLNDGREVIGREANGGFLPLFMTMGKLSGSNGYCAVLRDITQWKRSEEELRSAKRAAETANSHKSDFLARVSHEIRTPLNAIIGFSEMMMEERFGPIGHPRYLEYARDIGSSGKHVLDIVNDLLDISKIEAGEVDLEFGAVSLNDRLAECVSMLQPMANGQRVIIRTSLSASVPEVVADDRSIKQIALNVLSNAIRFTPSGGQIVVSTAYESSGSVVLRIRDTGIGMTRKELEQAMKPFGQVGQQARPRGDGTGLGLPLTRAMVEANRAHFDIVSTPKEGTLVTVAFPPQRVLAD